MSEENKKIIENNIELFTDIAGEVMKCYKGKIGDKSYFNCEGCDKIGECMRMNAEFIATISTWIVNILTLELENPLIEGMKKKITDIFKSKDEELKEDLLPKDDLMYS